MLIVSIIGGLGNQMFQYAYAYALSRRGYDVKLSIDSYEGYTLHDGFVLDEYRISLPLATTKEMKKLNATRFLKRFSFLPSVNYIKEKSLLFDNKFLTPEDNKCIVGYFQCENYFKEYRQNLLKEFVQKKSKSTYTQNLENKITNTITAISLHIRRGDYIKDKKTNKLHGTCSLNYYEQSMEYFNAKYKDIVYYIFSDDIEWVRSNFHRNNFVYISSKEKRLPHEDIYLMSLCNHNIIANSSFSWWGAWLNNHTCKEVIAPKKWFQDSKKQTEAKDIIPIEWIKL
jgi:hypothetical protein